MAQQVVHAVVTLLDGQTLSDNVNIGFTFESTGSDVGLDYPGHQQTGVVGPDSMASVLEAFFNSTQAGQTHPMAYYLSADLSRAANASKITYYDVTNALNGKGIGSPVATDTFTLGPAAGIFSAPPELAICVGYRADYGSDIEHGPSASLPSTDEAIDEGAPATHTGSTRPRARDRGRFYLGPLIPNIMGGNLNTPIDANKIDPACVADVNAAADNLFKTKNAGKDNQFNMVVWSRAGQSVKPIKYYYVDEGFAIQRRRGDTTQNRVHNWSSV